MIEFARDPANRVDFVIVYAFSRFFRNVKHYLNFKDLLGTAGVELISATQDIPSGSAGRLMETIIAAFDEHSSEVNAATVRDVMANNAEAGFWNGAVPPFGYKTIVACVMGKKEKKSLAVDDDEEPTVKLIFALYLGRQSPMPAMGIKQIASYLNERNIKHRGSVFHTSTVEIILKRTTYKGEHYYNKTDFRTKEERPQIQWIKVDVPQIISPEDFDAVQRKLQTSRPKVTAPRVVNGPTLLVGLAYCELCGGAMMLRTGKSGQYRYLTCASHATRGKVVCSGQSIRMDAADEAVISEVESQVFTPVRLKSILKEMVDQSQAGRARIEEEIASEKTRSASATKQLSNLYDLVAKGLTDTDDPISDKKSTDSKLQKSEAESSLISLKHRLSYQPIELDTVSLQRFSSGVRERLRSSDPAFRRDWLRLFVDQVVIGPEKIAYSRSEKALYAGAASGDAANTQPVPSFAREWRTRQDSNLWPLPSEGSALSS